MIDHARVSNWFLSRETRAFHSDFTPAKGTRAPEGVPALASSISGPIRGQPAVSWSRTVSQVREAASGLGWAKMVRNTAATMSLCDFGAALGLGGLATADAVVPGGTGDEPIRNREALVAEPRLA
jgi:hypothetical protein